MIIVKMCTQIELFGIRETYRSSLLYGAYKCALALYPLLDTSIDLDYDTIIWSMMRNLHDFNNKEYNLSNVMKQYHLTLRFLIDVGVKIKSGSTYIFVGLIGGIPDKETYSAFTENDFFYKIYDDLLELGMNLSNPDTIGCVRSFGSLLVVEKLGLTELFLCKKYLLYELVPFDHEDYFNIWELLMRYNKITDDDLYNILKYVMRDRIYFHNSTSYITKLNSFFKFFKQTHKIVLMDDLLQHIVKYYCSSEALENILNNVDDIHVSNVYEIDISKPDIFNTLQKYGIAVVWKN